MENWSKSSRNIIFINWTGIKVSLSLSSLITTGILSRGGYVAYVEQTKSAISAI